MKKFYVDDPESDMRCVYDRLVQYFNDGPWELSGESIEALDKYVKTHMWPFESGDLIVRRWINSGLATCTCLKILNE